MGSRKHNRQDDDYERRHSKKSKHRDSKDIAENNLSEEFKASIQPITTEDYFEKASEYRVWLKEKKHKYFSELDATDARYYFKKFVKAWNRFELEEKYYKGINSTTISSSDTTSYQWAFAKNINTEELDYVKDKVDAMTGRSSRAAGGVGASSTSSSGRRRANVGPTLPPSATHPSSSSSSKSTADNQADREEKWERNQRHRKAEYQAQKRRTTEYVNDTVPKLEGREAKLAEKRAANALRRREKSPDVELNDQDIYGGGADEYRTRLAAEKRQQERRQARYEEKKEQRMAPIKEKLADYKAKENETMAMFRRLAEEQKRRGGLQ